MRKPRLDGLVHLLSIECCWWRLEISALDLLSAKSLSEAAEALELREENEFLNETHFFNKRFRVHCKPRRFLLESSRIGFGSSCQTTTTVSRAKAVGALAGPKGLKGFLNFEGCHESFFFLKLLRIHLEDLRSEALRPDCGLTPEASRWLFEQYYGLHGPRWTGRCWEGLKWSHYCSTTWTAKTEWIRMVNSKTNFTSKLAFVCICSLILVQHERSCIFSDGLSLLCLEFTHVKIMFRHA